MVLVDFSTGNALVAGDTAENPAPPEAAWILDLFQSSRAYFKSFRDGADLADEYISGEREVPVPVDMPVDEIRPATAYAIVQVAADHVDVSNPAISVPAPSPRAHARAERIQKFLQGAWAHIPDHVKRAAVKHSVAYGIGFLKTWWDGDKWPEAPREEEYPDEGDYKAALTSYRLALRDNPTDPRILQNMAIAFTKTGLMDERDYRTYVELFRHMSNFMCKPNVIIFLDVTPERSLERIEARARGPEEVITLDYLRALEKGYREFIDDISRVLPVVRVDYDQFATAEEMAEVIHREYLTHSFLREATRFDPTR